MIYSRLFRGALAFFLLLFSLPHFGCGYTFQYSGSSELQRLGVGRIYISKLKNSSFKPGVENAIYNDLTKTVNLHRKVSLVQSQEAADAVLTGTITLAEFQNASPVAGSDLTPNELAGRFGRVQVSNVFIAILECSFNLAYREGRSPNPKSLNLWSSKFTRVKKFPASNQVGPLGTTSPLINESEFDRALLDLSKDMMEEVHEQMLARF